MNDKIFIGSSNEQKSVVEAIAKLLKNDGFNAIPWYEESILNIFELSNTNIEALVKAVYTFNYAIFILTPDDPAIVKGQKCYLPRDNVIFELGLFMGYLGRDRVYLVVPNKDTPRIASDLQGLITARYEPDKATLADALQLAAEKILARIRAVATKRLRLNVPVLDSLCEIVARACARGANVEPDEVRAFIHIYNSKTEHLEPIASYTGKRRFKDAGMHIPCSTKIPDVDWYIISRAFNSNDYCCADVNNDRRPMALENVPRVSPDLKAVAAMPIRRYRSEMKPIGTVCLDSSETVSTMHWKMDHELEDILVLFSDAVHALLVHHQEAP